ncbi:MAG: O-antigen ligase family protein [Microbacterium sp.]
MARISSHPVGPAPTAPERETMRHRSIRAFATFLLFSALGHAIWYNLLGYIGTLILMSLLIAGTLGIWVPRLVRSRREAAFPWRRLPWVALGYLAYAIASVFWSGWPEATLVTWAAQFAFTIAALFIADTLSWRELARALEVALRWIMGLSVVIELWVAAVLRHPLLPDFSDAPANPDPHWYWVRGNLFTGFLTGDRIQGVVGNSNQLGFLSLIALFVFALQLADRRTRPLTGWLWLVVTGYLFIRAESATAIVSGLVTLVALAAALLLRRASRAEARTKLYALFGGVIVAGVIFAVLAREELFALLGRKDTLTGRTRIWQAVWERAITHPVFGNGFSSPWVPWDKAFDGWIIDHGTTVFHAHDMWLDVFMQLGVVGVVLLAAAYLSLLWRSWFFAVDRPRWDLRDDRPFQALTLLPLLVVVSALTRGLAESSPIMLWGWMILVMLTFKIKSAPLVGHDETRQVAPDLRELQLRSG